MPLISVILPTYNRQQFLLEAMESILKQTFQDFELIVADDGSTDATPQIVEALSRQDSRVIYLPLPHTGRSFARNQAMKIARGQFIAFQDSDDISLPHRLAMQLEAIQKQPELGLVYCSTVYINSQGDLLNKDYLLQPTDDLYQAILVRNYRAIGPMTAMVPKKVIDTIGGYDENLDRFEDLDFYLRVAARYPTQAITEPLVYARFHDENAMPSQQPREVLRNLDAFAAKVQANDKGRTSTQVLKAGLANLYLIYANETCRYFSFKDSAPFYRRAFSLSPSFRQIAWFLLALTGLTQKAYSFLNQRTRSS